MQLNFRFLHTAFEHHISTRVRKRQSLGLFKHSKKKTTRAHTLPTRSQNIHKHTHIQHRLKNNNNNNKNSHT